MAYKPEETQGLDLNPKDLEFEALKDKEDK